MEQRLSIMQISNNILTTRILHRGIITTPIERLIIVASEREKI